MTVTGAMTTTNQSYRRPNYDSRHSTGRNGTVGDDHAAERHLTAFEKLTLDLSSDQKYLKEITLGKRIGFYRIRGDLGSGNFSQVKLGIHVLTKGKLTCVFSRTNLCPVALQDMRPYMLKRQLWKATLHSNFEVALGLNSIGVYMDLQNWLERRMSK